MPVFSSHLVDYKGLEVGKRIRDERRRKGLTLRRLAEHMGLSEATLSNIETDKVSLDLTELGLIASALEVPVATFLPRSHMSHYLVKRANEVANEPLVSRKLAGPEPGPPIHHNAGRPLAGLFVGKQMEPLLAEIRALPDKDLHFIGHDHEEFMFVLRGEVEMILKTNEGLVTERLGPGDCVYFRSLPPIMLLIEGHIAAARTRTPRARQERRSACFVVPTALRSLSWHVRWSWASGCWLKSSAATARPISTCCHGSPAGFAAPSNTFSQRRSKASPTTPSSAPARGPPADGRRIARGDWANISKMPAPHPCAV